MHGDAGPSQALHVRHLSPDIDTRLVLDLALEDGEFSCRRLFPRSAGAHRRSGDLNSVAVKIGHLAIDANDHEDRSARRSRQKRGKARKVKRCQESPSGLFPVCSGGLFRTGGVLGEGLEPTLLAEPDPKSGASANFATRAQSETLTSCMALCQPDESFWKSFLEVAGAGVLT